MKKHLLLSFLFIAIMFTGCQEPDDDVDMPVPEKPVAEQIQGEWLNYQGSNEYFFNPDRTDPYEEWNETFELTDAYRLDASNISRGYAITSDYDGAFSHYIYTDVDTAPYTVFKRPDGDYIRYQIPGQQVQDWKIAAINDSTMTWEQEKRNMTYFSAGNEVLVAVTLNTMKFRRLKVD